MSPAFKHIVLPSIMPLLFFAVAATPVEVLGCRTRGLLAFGMALVSVLAGLGAAVMALRLRIRGDERSTLWIITSLVLAIPAVSLLVLA